MNEITRREKLVYGAMTVAAFGIMLTVWTWGVSTYIEGRLRRQLHQGQPVTLECRPKGDG